jgi:hypothetical protein
VATAPNQLYLGPSLPLDQSHEVHFQNDEMINIAQDHTYSMLSFVDGSELYKFAQLMEIDPNWKRLVISKQFTTI